MNFASALFSLKRGHKIKRKHWTGWWELDGNEVMMHCYDGRVINIRDSEDITYHTMSTLFTSLLHQQLYYLRLLQLPNHV